MERAPKRQFQPSISGYFSTLHRTEGTHHVQSVAVSASVQASLLNVGMRVRKAVPEGYKTLSAHPKKPMEENQFLAPVKPHTVTRAAELAPFCGIHKIGGYAPQYSRPETEHGFLPSSQESWASSVSTESTLELPHRPVPHRKHAREADEEIEIQEAINQARMRATAFDHDVVASTRRIAHPSSRKKRTILTRTVSETSSTIVELDFEDAEFLEPGTPTTNDVRMDDDW